ncbi:DUF6401 family natural product biosynthesis protein [Nocardia rhizosphaerihabitans]|uniref:DUF6401 family natural product biosynthesis protein n=1 Tax=Nocardia rhizosphaerihabitans TaxID=1691570 RepID=UPI00366CCBC1
MFTLSSALLEVSARRHLRQVNIEYGIPAAAAAAVQPAVLAQLDQHAAAVRDILEYGVDDSARIPISILLAGYVRGLLDQVGEGAGQFAGVPPQTWHDADWLQLRLAAVCRHAAV